MTNVPTAFYKLALLEIFFPFWWLSYYIKLFYLSWKNDEQGTLSHARRKERRRECHARRGLLQNQEI